MTQNLPVMAPHPTGNSRQIVPREPLDFDDSNGRSVLNLVSATASKKISRALQTDPDLFELTEKELEVEFKKEDLKITLVDRRLRYKFWDEYDQAQGESCPMVMKRIYSGVVSKPYFYDKFLDDPHKIAWLLCIPATYETKMEEALSFGIDRLRQMLSLSPTKWISTGKDNGCKGKKKATIKKEVPDAAIMKIQFEITRYMDERVRGATVQKTQNLNVNAELPKPSQSGQVSQEEMDKVNQEIEVLEGRAQGPGPVTEKVIDAEVIDKSN